MEIEIVINFIFSSNNEDTPIDFDKTKVYVSAKMM